MPDVTALTNHLLLDLHPFGIAFVNDKVFVVLDDDHGKVVLATLDDTLLSAQLIVDMSWGGMRMGCGAPRDWLVLTTHSMLRTWCECYQSLFRMGSVAAVSCRQSKAGLLK